MFFRPWHPVIFFLAFLFVGCWILDGYGISWDESIQRRHGRVSIDYAAEKLDIDDHVPLEPTWDLEDYQWSNYGMIFQITANLLEQKFGYEDSPYLYYKLRHYLCFGLFWLASIFFYLGLRIRFPNNAWYPLIGTLLLILSPRIFANAFYNPKDHILLAFYIVSTTTLLRFLHERTWRNLVFHAFATGLVLNTRLPALIVPLTTVLIVSWEFLRERPSNLRNLYQVVIYLPLSAFFMIPFFPYLWEDTVNRLILAFTEMSDFIWGGYVVLFGHRFQALDLPAYYVPAWIVVTTPLLYLLFLVVGIFATSRNIFANLRHLRFWRTKNELLDFAQIGLALGPILVVIVLGSTLYNGWRHLHFVYPSMVFLMLIGFDWMRSWVERRKRGEQGNGMMPVWIARWPVLLLGIALVTTAAQMVRYHPHQYVYFNAAIRGEPLNLRFDMDYWGVGFRDAFLQLANQIPEGEARSIHCDSVWPCRDNYNALPPAAKAKFRLEDTWDQADYLATNFISYESRQAVHNRENHFAFPVVEVRPAGELTVGIYDIKKPREE